MVAEKGPWSGSPQLEIVHTEKQSPSSNQCIISGQWEGNQSLVLSEARGRWAEITPVSKQKSFYMLDLHKQRFRRGRSCLHSPGWTWGPRDRLLLTDTHRLSLCPALPCFQHFTAGRSWALQRDTDTSKELAVILLFFNISFHLLRAQVALSVMAL